MKSAPQLLLTICLICLSGCRRSEPVTDKAEITESTEFKALLQASGGTYFERTLPDNLKSTDWVYAALAYPNGEKKAILGVSEQGVEFSSDTVKVYFFEGKHDGIPYVALQVSEHSMGTGATEYAAEDQWKARILGKQQGAFSDPLIRFSTSGSIAPIAGPEIPEGCFDLVLYVDPEQPGGQGSQ